MEGRKRCAKLERKSKVDQATVGGAFALCLAVTGRISASEDFAPKWLAGESDRTQFTAHERKPVDCPRRGCQHGGQAVGAFPGQYDAGHLSPCVDQEGGNPGDGKRE